MISNFLHELGRHARLVLAVGCVAALFLPELSSAIRPALPALVSMVLGLSMARLDLAAIAQEAVRPKALVRSVGLALLIMPLTACLYAAVSGTLGLSETDHASLILLAAAPPIASAAGLCFILGFNARLALETTLVATILTPVIGPLLVAVFLPEAAPISPILLAQRLGLMVAGGLAIGIAIRAVVGPARVDRNKLTFDGVATLGMILFVIPLFDGVGATILADPARALAVLALVFIFNMGVNLAVYAACKRRFGHDSAGTLGLVWGNRTVAIYLAALPHDPQFALFVALFQFPMYLTPLVWGFWGLHQAAPEQVHPGQQQND